MQLFLFFILEEWAFLGSGHEIKHLKVVCCFSAFMATSRGESADCSSTSETKSVSSSFTVQEMCVQK